MGFLKIYLEIMNQMLQGIQFVQKLVVIYSYFGEESIYGNCSVSLFYSFILSQKLIKSVKLYHEPK